MHQNASVAKWYQEHGRHQIWAGGKNVELSSYEHSLKLKAEDVEAVRKESELPQTARDEKMARRKAAKEAAQVRAYYEEQVLGQKSKDKLVQITTN